MYQNSPNIFGSSFDIEEKKHLFSDEDEDLSQFLGSLGAKYIRSRYYLEVGNIQETQGWILHLTIIKAQLTQLVNFVTPGLIMENIAFSLPANRSIANDIIDGALGPAHLGKVIIIFPSTDEQASYLATRLVELTKDLKGPAVRTDLCLKNIVYTRHASISDMNNISSYFPKGISWPFYNLSEPSIPKPAKLLNSRYYLHSTICNNPKGDIRKAIYFKSPWNIKACAIKEGRTNMFSDESGRDATDRIKWQHEVCTEMAGIIPIPKVFDYFIENGNSYLAIEFVKGKALDHWLSERYKSRTWSDLPLSTHLEILNILLQTIKIIHHMHEHGFVHRDVTGTNFIVTPQNKSIPIDLELAWPINKERLSSPFLLGTPGFLSPQQAAKEIPTPMDDIYSLGALLLEAFTNCLPLKLICTNWHKVYDRSLFFTRDKMISRLIADCLQQDPSHRPNIDTLEESFTTITGLYKKNAVILSGTGFKRIDSERIKTVIQTAINGLVGQRLRDTKTRWMPSTKNKDEGDNSETDDQELDSSDGWHTGKAGILWFVAEAGSAGFDISACKNIYVQNWEHLLNEYSVTKNIKDSSLFYGSSGIALAVSKSLSSGLLTPDDHTIDLLHNCFSVPSPELDFSIGIAGQGMAILSASKWLQESYSQHLLASITTELLARQEPDGSWALKRIQLGKKWIIAPGIDNGISGILLFLLAKLEYSTDLNIEPAIRKALGWVVKSRTNKRIWKKAQINEFPKGWTFSRTAVDISFLMIRCFEIFNERQFKQLAESLLRTIPDRPFLSDFSLHTGMTRIGDLYLEAYRVFRESVWLDKAGWIADVLLHSFIQNNDREGHWVVSTDLYPVADLFRGNSGVIHFLIRYMTEGKINSPLFPLSNGR